MCDPLESQSHIDDYFDIVTDAHVNEFRDGDFEVRILESLEKGNFGPTLKWRSKERKCIDTPLPTIRVRDLQTRPVTSIRIMFPGFDEPNRYNLQGLRDLYEDFSFPTVFLKERVQGVANSFGIRDTVAETQDSWFHFLCKNIVLIYNEEGQAELCGPTPEDHRKLGKQSWIQGGFFMKWSKVGGNILLCCFGSFPKIEQRLKRFVENPENVQTALFDPYALYVIILDELHAQMHLIVLDLKKAYDETERHIFDFASAQQKRSSSGYDVDFVRLHHLEKLVIHLKEGCEAVMETAKSIQTAHDELFEAAKLVQRVPHSAIPATKRDLQYLLSSFHALDLQIKSIETRVMNAINLAFNLVIQRDSTLIQADSQSMKTVAFMTLVFLPGTAVATIFGTQFFNQDSETGRLQVATDFWLLWALIAATTVVTLVIWYFWLRVDMKMRYSSGEVKKEGRKAVSSSNAVSMA